MARRFKPFFVLAGLIALGGSVNSSKAQDLQVPAGFKPLFNGQDLSGWHGWKIHDPNSGPYAVAQMDMEQRDKAFSAWTEDALKHWTVQNGELVNDGNGAYLATKDSYRDYELLIDYKTVAKADSGIYLKATPQVQIWDYTDPAKFRLGADKGSGGLWNNNAGSPGKDPLVLADKPFGEWNSFRIIQVGERTTIYLNNKLVVDNARMENYWDKAAKRMPVRPLPVAGPIILQTHGGEIRWRNIFIKELSSEEANEYLKRNAGEGYQPAFDGKSLEGWTGALDSYEVRDGMLCCKATKGGALFTKNTYNDFTALVEYRVPPGGNNGLAIRHPGKGRPSQDGMCEVQILDDDHPKYTKLDPRQFTGSAYGMVAAERGYQRKAGEWNLMMVTAKGSNLTVELNGTQILNADLSKVTEFKDNLDHPGKDRQEGHFGLCGHRDPVEFRTIWIRNLQ